MLGITNPNFPGMLPFPFSSPPTDVVKGSLEATPIGTLADGTQLWRLFHNGVDTHPIHTHLFTAQVINRVGQDGQVASGTLPVDPSDLGWKDTVKMNPLEIVFLALRPTVPTVSQVPFEVPISIRLIDPTLPEGATLPPPGPTGWFDPATNAIPEILNHYVNFGWEYVWHCHILSHEEMDFMHSLVFAAPPRASTELFATWNQSTGGNRSVTLNWADNSTTETQFTIQRASDANFTTGLTTFIVVSPTPNTTGARTYTDTTVSNDTWYWYKVFANGAIVGDTSMANFPTMSADSLATTPPDMLGATATFVSILVGAAPGLPADPTGMNALVQANPLGGPQVRLRWTDNANNETSFALERCTGAGCGTTTGNFAQIAAVPPRTTGSATVTYFDTTVTPGNTYNYRVWAVNSAGQSSSPSPTTLQAVVAAVVPAVPAAPTNFVAANALAPVGGPNTTVALSWAHPGGANLTNFTIQRATNASFTTGLTAVTLGAIARSLTQSVRDNTTYYFRIRANNSISGSSAWTNALPYPIRTRN
jgi:hypothetical protein